MKDVIFVTGNADKANYFAKLIGMPIEHHDVDLDEIQSMDLRDVALDKAKRAYYVLKRPVLVEDLGMFLPALGGFPGPFVKFMLDGGKRLDILINVLSGYEDRTAISHTVFVYYDGKDATFFEGKLKGTIATELRGDGGFGWDPVFIPEGYGGRTRAQLSEAEDHETYLIAKPIVQIGEFLQS